MDTVDPKERDTSRREESRNKFAKKDDGQRQSLSARRAAFVKKARDI